MSDNDFERYVETVKADCPFCGDPIADHSVWEIGNCEHRKSIKRIFRDANDDKEPA